MFGSLSEVLLFLRSINTVEANLYLLIAIY